MNITVNKKIYQIYYPFKLLKTIRGYHFDVKRILFNALFYF